MENGPKQIKRLVREWARIAHDRDLRKALGELRSQFNRWDRGEIDAFELNDLVHRFHQDTSRQIWKRYATIISSRRLQQPSWTAFFGRRNCRPNSFSTSRVSLNSTKLISRHRDSRLTRRRRPHRAVESRRDTGRRRSRCEDPQSNHRSADLHGV